MESVMAHADNLAAEIEQLEKETYGKPTEEKAPEASEVKVEEPEKPASPSAPAEPVKAPVEQVTEAEAHGVVTPTPPTEDWEKRFKGYKSTTDATINGLRRQELHLREELQKADERVQDLARKFAELQTSKVDIFDDLFTKEEKDVLGVEALSALKKANEAMVAARVKPLEDQLNQERIARQDEQKRQLEAQKQKAEQEFLSKLKGLAPNYAEIDRNPRFIEWMRMMDSESGLSRAAVFKNAQNIGDVRRVAEFFLEFEQFSRPKPNQRLERKVTPTKEPAAPTPPAKRKGTVIDQKFVEDFYDACISGKYRGKEKERQEIDNAIQAYLRKNGMVTRK
jgi:hypothetical protein